MRRRHVLLIVLGLLAALASAQGKGYSVPIQGRADYLEVADVNGDGKRDLIVSHHEGRSRFLSWIQFDGQRFPARVVPVPLEATVAVVAEVLPAARPEIVFLGRDVVLARNLNVPGAEPQTIAKLPLFFDLPGRRLPFADLAADLDGDGRQDLVVPTPTGYGLLLARDLGQPVAVAGAAQQWVDTQYASDHFLELRWTLPQLALADMGGDGDRELVYFLDGVLGIYDGAAGSAPVQLRKEDGTALGSYLEAKKDDSIRRRRLLLADIDGDGRADVLTATNAGNISQLSSWGTSVAVYLNKGDGRPSQKADSMVRVRGVSIPPRLFDFDADGDLDLILSTVRTDLTTGISAATLKRITITYEVYPWEGARYASRPQLQRDLEIPLEGSMLEGGTLPFGYLHGDYDGDGTRDFLTVGSGEFKIFRGGAGGGGGLFSRNDGFAAKETWTIKGTVSNDVHIDDLDGDGKSEVAFLARDKVFIWVPEGLR